MERVQASTPLAPTDQLSGNTIAQDSTIPMTAPGSESVMPVPETLDNVPMPRVPPVTPMVPALDASGTARVDGHPDGSGGWLYAEEIPRNSHPQWKQL